MIKWVILFKVNGRWEQIQDRFTSLEDAVAACVVWEKVYRDEKVGEIQVVPFSNGNTLP